MKNKDISADDDAKGEELVAVCEVSVAEHHVADQHILQHHELQGRHQRHHDNVENAEDAISDDEPVNECLSRLFQKDVDERAIGRRDEEGEG